MKRIAAIAGLLLAIAGAGTPRAAQATEVDTILLSGQVVMRIRAGVKGLSPADRGEEIRSRLTALLTQPGLTTPDVRVQQPEPGRDALILLGDHVLVRVDQTLAQSNQMDDPLRLANLWAQNLKRVLPQAIAEAKQQQALRATLAAR